jgi:phosphate-selective porin
MSHIRELVYYRKERSITLLCFLIYCLFSLIKISEAKGGNEELNISSDQSLRLSGYIQAGYALWEKGREGFGIRRTRVILKGDILKNIDYKFQIDAVKTPILLDAVIGISLNPYAKLSFGQFKVPFSIENLTSASELETINLSNTVKNLCPGRDIGASGRDIGMTVIGIYSWIEFTLGVFNGSGINRTDYNEQKDLAGRLAFTPFRSLSIGFSHYDGRYSPDHSAPVIKKDRTGIDLFFMRDRSSLKGEYIFARDGQTERYGLYIQGGYFLIPEKLQVIIKYDYFDGNMDIHGDHILAITLGLNYYFSKKTKFQINYEYNKGQLDVYPKDVLLAQIQAGF